MNILVLDNVEVEPLTMQECIEVNGGLIEVPKWIKGLTPVAVGAYIIENWSDIKKGLSEGWNLK